MSEEIIKKVFKEILNDVSDTKKSCKKNNLGVKKLLKDKTVKCISEKQIKYVDDKGNIEQKIVLGYDMSGDPWCSYFKKVGNKKIDVKIEYIVDSHSNEIEDIYEAQVNIIYGEKVFKVDYTKVFGLFPSSLSINGKEVEMEYFFDELRKEEDIYVKRKNKTAKFNQITNIIIKHSYSKVRKSNSNHSR